MKIHFTLLISMLTCSISFSQVGINTENPLQLFHTDGQKDNPLTGVTNASQEINDVVITNQGQIGIGIINPIAKIHIENEESLPSIIIKGISNQPVSSNSAFLTIDNSTGEIYKGGQSEKTFFYQEYNINNVNGDWLKDFDTKISETDYSVIVVGSFFNQLLETRTNNGKTLFTSQNVYATPVDGTWRLSADFFSVNSSDISGNSVNGSWKIYTMIIRNNQVETNPVIITDLDGSNSGSASNSPVP